MSTARWCTYTRNRAAHKQHTSTSAPRRRVTKVTCSPCGKASQAPHLGRTSPRVGTPLRIVSDDRFFASAMKKSLGFCVDGTTKRPLDQTVFKRMKTDRHRNAARIQQCGDRTEPAFDLAELIVDGNSNRLKGAGGRIDTRAPRQHAVYCVAQLKGGPRLTGLDRSGDGS